MQPLKSCLSASCLQAAEAGPLSVPQKCHASMPKGLVCAQCSLFLMNSSSSSMPQLRLRPPQGLSSPAIHSCNHTGHLLTFTIITKYSHHLSFLGTDCWQAVTPPTPKYTACLRSSEGMTQSVLYSFVLTLGTVETLQGPLF